MKEERGRKNDAFRVSAVCKVSRNMSWFYVARDPIAGGHVLL